MFKVAQKNKVAKLERKSSNVSQLILWCYLMEGVLLVEGFCQLIES